MKTKKIEELLLEWSQEWGRLPSTGPAFYEFMAKKIKKNFRRRNPKWVVVEKKFIGKVKRCTQCGHEINIGDWS